LGFVPGRGGVFGRIARPLFAQTAGEDLVHLMQERASGGAARPGTQGAMLFSCNGRGTTMFPDADHDVRTVKAALGTPEDIAVAGFFAAGEIGPVGGRNHLHGFTASVLAFS
jgi:small ligand-binding sensory domain FIST